MGIVFTWQITFTNLPLVTCGGHLYWYSYLHGSRVPAIPGKRTWKCSKYGRVLLFTIKWIAGHPVGEEMLNGMIFWVRGFDFLTFYSKPVDMDDSKLFLIGVACISFPSGFFIS